MAGVHQTSIRYVSCVSKVYPRYHILFVTHMIMKDDPNPDNQKRTYNLNYMNSKVAGARRDGKKGRPKRIKHCLMNEDSSDEDDAQLALTW